MHTDSSETSQSDQDALIHNDTSETVTLDWPGKDHSLIFPSDEKLPGAPWTLGFPRGNRIVAKSYQQGTNYRRATTDQKQTVDDPDYAYRWPSLEAEAQWHRAQISLIDEQFAEYLHGHILRRMASISRNDLNSIDNSVYQSQIALLKSVLMSPVSGIVTGIYKNPGDWVAAGEPVIRVENTVSPILLVANLVYPGRVSVGSSLTVETTLFGAPAPPVSGQVVAIQEGRGEDDHWVVFVECKNLDGGGKPIFPVYYQFDYDNTNVSIS